ncbi:MAG: hypothetical protein LDL13_03545 [Calditerrivibrio sp.]|nr:hypothetical protein [Calditerrivibrio sp.]MCA1932635.1 hypothetical protein [Calditerrivibrio sp.]MCA1981006.1 hypothetical protein [Calditerrivibrio sp.]
MSEKNRAIFFCIILIALLFGFMHHFFPEIHFERLHIFLLNLCTGGTLIIYLTEGKTIFSLKTTVFFISSFIYAIFSFLEIYNMAIAISLLLFVVVETIRIKKFGFFPYNFFDTKSKMAEKFHNASLLCLSIGILLSTFAIINHEYLKLLPFRKFELNTFFLGFSFPVSLITLSIIFSTMKKAPSNTHKILKILSFWIINVGVIIFFIFILFESFILELIISLILFFTVALVFWMYYRLGFKEQRKLFLSSAIGFLNITAITGVAYIFLYFTNHYTPENSKIIKDIHRIVSLYGWNLTGIIVILRNNDFPIDLNSYRIILLHWISTIILIPAGYYFPAMALIATITFGVFIYIVLFRKTKTISMDGKVPEF